MTEQIQSWNAKTLFHRFAILAISLVITTGTSVSPALPAMERTFSNYPKDLVDMIATIQQVPAFIVILFSSQIALRLGLKRTISIGILTMGIAGMLPAVLNNLWLILFSRIIFGIGIGMINSLAVTIIELLYTNDNDRAQMLGNRSAFEPIGVCFANLLVGILLNINWHVSFLTYGLIIIVWLLFIQVVPNIPMRQSNSQGKASNKETVNLPVILASLLCVVLTMGSAILGVLTPSIMVNNHLGTATQSSYVLTAWTLVGMAMGFLFGSAFKLLHRYVLPFGLLLLLVGILIYNYAPNLVLLILGVIIAGSSYAFSGTYAFQLMGTLAPKNSTGLANSLLLVGCNIGTSISPIIIGSLDQVSPFGGFRPGITIYAILVFVILLGILLFQLFHPLKSVTVKN